MGVKGFNIMGKITLINRQVRKNYAELKDGTLVEIKNISDPDQYPKTVTVFENKLAKGAKAGQSEFSVAVTDFIPAVRVGGAVSTANKLENMLASGLTADEAVAQILAQAKAAKEAKEAK